MIQILWATIRPNTFIQMHTNWINRSENPENIKTLVAVNTQEEADFLSNYNTIVVNPKNIGVCEPSYKLSSSIEPADDDIIIFASDDFYPPEKWDTYLINKLKGKKGALFVRDGYQLPDSSNMLHPAITIPIMTGSCLKRMNNVIYHPVYNHMFSDCELYLNLKDLNLLIDDRMTDETTFQHLHYAGGKRQSDQFDKIYMSKWGMDQKKWNERKLIDVEKRLEV